MRSRSVTVRSRPSTSGPSRAGWRAIDPAGRAGPVMHGSDAAVTGVRVDPRDSLVVTMHADGSLRAWRAGSSSSVVLLASDDEWVVASDDGYFDASPHGGALLAAVEGTRAYPIDQLAARNNRPDLLLGRMGLGTPDVLEHYRARHEQRLRRLGLTEDGLAASFASAPRARIRSVSRDGKGVTLDVELSAEPAHLTAYNVYVDGVPLFGAHGKPASGTSVRLQEHVELTTGRNAIEVSAFDDRGRESLRAMRVLDYAPKTQPDLYFLGFGVSRYAHPAYDLRYAHKDALDLADVLQEMRGSGAFGQVHAMTRVDEQVTVEAIRGAKSYLAQARPDDVVVLFVGGHGLHAHDAAASYFYATYETDVARLDRTAASFELVEDFLQGVGPRRKLFLMDTCESGEKDDGEEEALRTRRSFVVDRDRFIEDDLARRSGAIVFSSSSGSERSFELRSLRNGAFTKAILRGLLSDAADADHDGMVSVRELRAYVSATVPQLTDGRQHPTVDRDNVQIDFAFPIVKSAKGVAVLDRDDPRPAALHPAPTAGAAGPGEIAPAKMPAGCGCREAAGGEAWPAGLVGALAALALGAGRRATRRSGSVAP